MFRVDLFGVDLFGIDLFEINLFGINLFGNTTGAVGGEGRANRSSGDELGEWHRSAMGLSKRAFAKRNRLYGI